MLSVISVSFTKLQCDEVNVSFCSIVLNTGDLFKGLRLLVGFCLFTCQTRKSPERQKTSYTVKRRTGICHVLMKGIALVNEMRIVFEDHWKLGSWGSKIRAFHLESFFPNWIKHFCVRSFGRGFCYMFSCRIFLAFLNERTFCCKKVMF